MLPYAVVADDLTGAGDSGVQFALAGLRTRLFLSDQPVANRTDVAVCSTDSRASSPSAAYRRVRSVVAALKALGTHEVYKKVDSTLRGNLGAELDAVLDDMPEAYALVCPAFPANGRTVVGGHLLVHGQPVSATAVAQDPATPVTESYIPAIVSLQSSRCVGRVTLEEVFGGPEQVAAALDRLLVAGAEVVVADAVTEADLNCLVAATRRLPRRAVLVGAAGLAAPLASYWATALGSAQGQPQRVEVPFGSGSGSAGEQTAPAGLTGGKVLAVVGSVHPAARAQLDMLVEQGMCPVELDLAAALADGDTWKRWCAEVGGPLEEALRGPGPGVVLTTPGTPDDVARARRTAQRCGYDPVQVPRLLAKRLAELTEMAVRITAVAGIILTGGDTAMMVLTELGANGIDLLGEVGPGVTVGRVAGGAVGGLPVVTKAGGFGGRDALWQAVRYLKEFRTLPS